MKILLLLPLLLGLMSPAIAHNEFNGGDAMHKSGTHSIEGGEEGEEGKELEAEIDGKQGLKGEGI